MPIGTNALPMRRGMHEMQPVNVRGIDGILLFINLPLSMNPSDQLLPQHAAKETYSVVIVVEVTKNIPHMNYQ